MPAGHRYQKLLAPRSRLHRSGRPGAACGQLLSAGPLARAPRGVARATATSRIGSSRPNQGGLHSPVRKMRS